MEEQTEIQRLAAFLPPAQALSSSTAGDTSASLFWTEAEIAAARRANIRAAIKRGWRYSEGVLVSPDGVKAQPSRRMPSKSGDPDFNPRRDAFAVRLGAEFVRDNRYYHPGTRQYMDRNGMFVPGPEEECFECGGLPWAVITRERLPPWAKPWEHNLTYCRHCVSPEEVERVRAAKQRELEQAEAKAQRYGRRR